MITTILAIKLPPTSFCFFFFSPFHLGQGYLFYVKLRIRKMNILKNLFTALDANLISWH